MDREALIYQLEAEFELTKHLAKQKLNHFTRVLWPVIEPATKYVHGWHIDAICEHLEAVKNFEIKRLIINIPPRHAKSILVSAMFPAWVWAEHPSRRFITSSYNYSLAIRDAVKHRDLITSHQYEQLIAPDWELKEDVNLKHRFENTRTGLRFSTSVGGTLTGEGGDYIIVDDPINAIEASSELVREACWTWWTQAMSTRVNDPINNAKIVIQQRLHEGDLTGKLLDQAKFRAERTNLEVEEYEILVLPAEYRPNSKIISHTSLNWRDPRVNEGEILWPERFNKESIAQLKEDLGAQAAEAQLSQDPKPGAGGLFKADWWKLSQVSPSEIMEVVQFWDCAQKPGITNDFSVCATWARTINGYFILDVYREKLTTPQLEAVAKELYDIWKPDAIVIEDKSAGSALLQYLLAFTSLPVLPYDPGKLDKETRATAATPTVEAGKVSLPKSAKWVETFISEHERFPKAAHDDQVDTTSMAVSWLKQRGPTTSGPRIRQV